jgi:hypothetical protein
VTTGYLVDTDWVIDHLSGVAGVTARLTELRPAGLAVSIISLAELYEGVGPCLIGTAGTGTLISATPRLVQYPRKRRESPTGSPLIGTAVGKS